MSVCDLLRSELGTSYEVRVYPNPNTIPKEGIEANVALAGKMGELHMVNYYRISIRYNLKTLTLTHTSHNKHDQTQL